MIYLNHGTVWENTIALSQIFNIGLNPFSTGLWSRGSGSILIFLPSYLLYLVFTFFGLRYTFILYFLIKMVPLIGDIIFFFTSYEIINSFLDDDISLKIASIFFLNPYFIYNTSILGTVEGVTITFIFISMYFLLKDKIAYASIFLSLSGFTRYFPMLLLPTFLFVIFNKDKKSIFVFIKNFIFSAFVLSLPHLTPFIQYLYISDGLKYIRVMINTYFLTVSGTSATLTGSTNFYMGFIPILLEFNLFEKYNFIFGSKSILAIYILCIFYLCYVYRENLKKNFKYESIHLINKSALILFSLIYILNTANIRTPQIMWLLPFLILECFLFKGLPTYYFHITWFLSLLLHGVIMPHYLEWGEATFNIPRVPPPLFGWNPSFFKLFPVMSWDLVWSIAFLQSIFFIFIILSCLNHRPNVNRSNGVLFIRQNINKSFMHNKFYIVYLIYSSISVMMSAQRIRYDYNNNLIITNVYYEPISIYLLMPLIIMGVYVISDYLRILALSRNVSLKNIVKLHVDLIKAIKYMTVTLLFTFLMYLRFKNGNVEDYLFLIIQILIMMASFIQVDKTLFNNNIQKISYIYGVLYLCLLIFRLRLMVLNTIFILTVILWSITRWWDDSCI